MRKGDLDRFFREASKRLEIPVRVYLTGGVASWLLGGDRPTSDIDFGLKTGGRASNWSKAQEAFQETSRLLGIPIQFSEDIARWGMIGPLNYEKSAKLYKRFGKISVLLLDPISWSIGKMNRYYRSDMEDLVAVFKSQKPPLSKVLKGWAQVLKKSPRSSSQFLFIKVVEDFLKEHGKKIWGSKFDSVKAFQKFKSKASRPEFL